MAVPAGKTFNLDTLEYEDKKPEEQQPPAAEVKTEEKTDPPAKEDEKEPPAVEAKKEDEVQDPPLLEEEEEEEEQEEDPAAKPKGEELESIGIDDFIAEKYAAQGIKTEEELDGVLDSYGKLQTDFDVLKKENETLKATPGKPVFDSEQQEKIYNFVKDYDLDRVGEGIQTAGRLIGLNIDTAEPRILLEEKFALEHPELTREESLRMFNRDWNKTYNIKLENFDGDDEAFKEEQELLKIQQKTQVAKAKEFLSAKQKEVKAKPKEATGAPKVSDSPVVKTSVTKNVQALEEFIPKFNSIVYSPSDNDQDDFTVNFSKDQLKEMHGAMKDWVSNPGSYDAKGNLIGESAFDPDLQIRKLAYLMYGDEIAAKIYAHAMSQADIKRADQIAKVKPNREAKTAVSKVTGVSEEKQQEMLIRRKQAERNGKGQVYR